MSDQWEDDMNSEGSQPRFQVERVNSMSHDNEPSVTYLTPDQLTFSSATYDTRYLKSLRHLTREALPKEHHYRDLKSITAQYKQRPTLDELREQTSIKHTQPVEVDEEDTGLKKGVIKFGWLEGVFMRCLLNIWGVMLFLRLSWVIGQAGIWQGLVVITLANIVTVITGISMSAVSTNGMIKSGGIYYMISRSLGPEFGGAIGLMFTLANSIAVAIYVVGFCESLNDLLASQGVQIVDGGINDTRIVGLGVLIVILIVAFIGMEWVTRAQMFLLVVLVASQVDFVVGALMGPQTDESIAKGFTGFSTEVFEENFNSDYREFEGANQDFFSVFAVFFPAVTGIVAGANLSGDLKDPGVAIPKGTLLSIGFTYVTYIIYGAMLGGCAVREASGNVFELNETIYNLSTFGDEYVYNCTDRTCEWGLHNSAQVMELVSAWGPLIYGGCFAATLSSAIASLVGAPRVFQALARDKLYPGIEFFAQGYGANNDPVRGYVICAIIAAGCIVIGELNAIAPLLSNFFLAAYALINFSVFHATISKSPGWRPSFKFYNAWLSLLGTVLCLGVMFLISWYVALITFAITVTLYLYVSYRKPEANWGSSTQAQTYNSALKAVYDLNLVDEHVKNYRPQLLVLSGMPSSRPTLIDLANQITKGMSLLICGQVIKDSHNQRTLNSMTRQANNWLSRRKIRAFYNHVLEENFANGSKALMQLAGVGKLKPNLLLLGYKADWLTCSGITNVDYFDVIQTAFDNYLAVGVLRLPEGLDYTNVVVDEGNEMEVNGEERSSKNNGGGDNEDDSRPPTPEISREVSPVENKAVLKKKRNRKHSISQMFRGPGGAELPREVLDNLNQFHVKKKGFIDVWWLYDDGGLTLLIPYILTTRSQWSSCKLRIFSLANRRDELEREQRSMATLLSKFRIDYSDVVIIPDVAKKCQDTSRKEYENLIDKFRERNHRGSGDTAKGEVITDAELLASKDRINRHIRLRELLLQHSKDSTLVVMTLPMPKKETVSAPLYMSWLETLTRGMPPFLLLRGNQTSVLTFYS